MSVKKDTLDSPLAAVCKLSRLKCKMGMHWLLSKMDMASMQSSRSQCCCCAVGVFAAFFGIFMLSAGICIVLNVNYMEVDTSGLPPELHNEDGKRVVGIILICVALGALGLSVTVSIIYFAVCNRDPRRPVKNSNTTGTANGAVANGPNGTYSNNTHNHRPSSDSNHQRAADGSRNSFDSQLSLNSLPRHRRASPALAASRGATGTRKKAQSKAKSRRMRPPRYQTGLPPHQEEPETTKSQVDLKLHQSRSATSPSVSQMSPTHSQSHNDPSTSYTVDETQTSGSPKKSGKVPAIIINDSSSSPNVSTKPPKSDPHASQSVDITDSNTSFTDAPIGESLMLTEESTLFDEADTDEPEASGPHPQFELQEGSRKDSPVDQKHIDSTDAKNRLAHIPSSDSSGFTSQQEHHPNPVSNSPESMIPSTADMISEKEESSSIDSYTHNVVQVQPKNVSDFSHRRSGKKSHSKTSSHKQSKSDNISELPMSSRHHEMYADSNDNDSERRCESQSSFNSAFSNEGGDPDDEEMKRMHEKMRELLD